MSYDFLVGARKFLLVIDAISSILSKFVEFTVTEKMHDLEFAKKVVDSEKLQKWKTSFRAMVVF